MEFYLALLLVLAALACWGSWSNTLLFNKGCFEAYFFGLCFGYGVTGFLAVQSAHDVTFPTDSEGLIAVAAGAMNNVGQLSLVFAIQLTGMTIALPLIMGIELIVGTILLYFQDSKEDAGLLFSGVLLVLFAVCCDILSQLQIVQDESNQELAGLLKAATSAHDLLNDMESSSGKRGRFMTFANSNRIDMLSSIFSDRERAKSLPAFGPRISSVVGLEDPDVSIIRKRSMKALSNVGLINYHHELWQDLPKVTSSGMELYGKSKGGASMVRGNSPREPLNGDSSERRKSSERKQSGFMAVDDQLLPMADEELKAPVSRILIGVFVSIVAGMSFAAWPLLVGDSSLPWKKFYLYFAWGMFFMSFFTTPVSFFVSKPPIDSITFTAFALGMLGGVIQGSGSFFLFWARETIHFVVAISIVRCAPVIAALWGIFFWKELEHAGSTARLYIALMFVCYLCAIFLIALSDKS